MSWNWRGRPMMGVSGARSASAVLMAGSAPRVSVPLKPYLLAMTAFGETTLETGAGHRYLSRVDVLCAGESGGTIPTAMPSGDRPVTGAPGGSEGMCPVGAAGGTTQGVGFAA